MEITKEIEGFILEKAFSPAVRDSNHYGNNIGYQLFKTYFDTTKTCLKNGWVRKPYVDSIKKLLKINLSTVWPLMEKENIKGWSTDDKFNEIFISTQKIIRAVIEDNKDSFKDLFIDYGMKNEEYRICFDSIEKLGSLYGLSSDSKESLISYFSEVYRSCKKNDWLKKEDESKIAGLLYAYICPTTNLVRESFADEFALACKMELFSLLRKENEE